MNLYAPPSSQVKQIKNWKSTVTLIRYCYMKTKVKQTKYTNDNHLSKHYWNMGQPPEVFVVYTSFPKTPTYQVAHLHLTMNYKTLKPLSSWTIWSQRAKFNTTTAINHINANRCPFCLQLKSDVNKFYTSLQINPELY